MYISTTTTHEITHFTSTITPIYYNPYTEIIGGDSLFSEHSNSRNIGNDTTPVEEIVYELLADYYFGRSKEINIDNYYNEDIDDLPDDITEDINLN